MSDTTQQAEAAVETAVETAAKTEVKAEETKVESAVKVDAQAVINDVTATAGKVIESAKTELSNLKADVKAAAAKVEEKLEKAAGITNKELANAEAAVEAALTVYVVKHTLPTGQTRLLAARRTLDGAKAELATIFRTATPPMGQPNYTTVGTSLMAAPQGVVSPGVGQYSIETLSVL
jgi:hypothetical protein